MTKNKSKSPGVPAPDAVGEARILSIRKRQSSRQAAFLKILAESSNVKEAARRANISAPTAYRWRRQDAAFRAQWMAALDEGYEQLELEMLARMRDGTPKYHFHGGQLVHTEMVHNDAVAIRLLALHRETVAANRAARPTENIHAGAMRDRLNRKLDDMRERFLARHPRTDTGPDA